MSHPWVFWKYFLRQNYIGQLKILCIKCIFVLHYILTELDAGFPQSDSSI